jgi:NAD dependent epimerase/dehydratase family enzyme
MDIAPMTELLQETALHHDRFEKVAPPHEWRDWYAAYMVAHFVTASLRVMPRRALDKGYTFRFPGLEPALRDLLGK